MGVLSTGRAKTGGTGGSSVAFFRHSIPNALFSLHRDLAPSFAYPNRPQLRSAIGSSHRPIISSIVSSCCSGRHQFPSAAFAVRPSLKLFGPMVLHFWDLKFIP
jgi:hypothetical protein